MTDVNKRGVVGALTDLLGKLQGAPRLGTWTTVGSLPDDFVPAGMCDLGPDHVLLYGRGGPRYGVEKRKPVILRYDGSALETAWSGPHGWIQAADHRDREVWAAKAEKHPDRKGSWYALLVSQDGGVSWSQRGKIPTTSLTSLCVEAPGVGWALGAGRLLRSEDGGESWHPVEAPGTRRGVSEPLVAVAPEQVVLGGKGLFRSDDGGRSWSTLSSDEIRATDGTYVVGLRDETLTLGRIAGDSIEWVGEYPQKLYADQVVHRGDGVRIRTVDVGQRAGTGVYILDSRDGGATLREHRLIGSSDLATVALCRDGRVWRMTVRRNLRLLTPDSWPQ